MALAPQTPPLSAGTERPAEPTPVSGTAVHISDAPTMVGERPPRQVEDGDTMARQAAPRTSGSGRTGLLTVGEAFGPRYHIIRLLGAGGMGAVYQAWDAELGVAVALKVIRPQAADDAAVGEELERRFKRELLLSRQVTHANVVRIHDLGEIDGIKYFTMTYVDGSDLSKLLAKSGRLPLPQAIAIAKQVAYGLRAAHQVGVVHRDLKPANVMVAEDEALIMDFGIARSVESKTMGTGAGNIVGTVAYMAPEQARGEKVDHRADIYAFGLIFYHMLVGPFRQGGETSAMADLVKRMQHGVPDIRSVDPQIPEPVAAIVTRCVAIDLLARYQKTGDLVADLARIDADGQRIAAPRPSARIRAPLAVALSLGLILLAAVAWWIGRRTAAPGPAVARAPISVLVANFENRTGDPVFDGVLEQAVGLGIEGASFITAYPQRDALRSAATIKAGSRLDEQTARLVAVRDGVKLVVRGSVAPAGSGYAMSVGVIDAADGKDVATAEGTAADKSAVLAEVGRMATSLRRDLGETTAGEGDAGVETFTAASLEAARAYVLGSELAAAGKFAEAIAQYQEAVQRDPNFGRAYSGWATAALRAGRPDEADELYKKALSLLERMTEREKFRTLGAYYLGPGANDEQAVENYRALVEKYPSDGPGLNNLAVAYFRLLDYAKATQQGQKATEVYPKSLNYRTNLALYAMYASDFETATAEAQKAIALSPFDKAYLPLAMAALVAGKPDEALSAYAEMAKASTRGASIASMGRADLAMYQGRYAEARTELEAGAKSDEAGNLTAPRALKLVALAESSVAIGSADAPKLLDQALALTRADAVVVPAARLFASIGRADAARGLAEGLEKQLQKRSRALGGVIRAELALVAKKPVEAIDALTTARGLADLWLVRYMLGRAYVEAGKHAEAVAELEACQKRIGEASDVFLDDWPTFRYTAPLKYWLARAQDGLGLKDSAAKGYEAYLELRGNVPGDALAKDARKRTASR